MSIYEYYCEKCDKIFDLILSFSEYNKMQKCEKCNKSCKRNYHGNRTALKFIGKWEKTGGY